MTTRQLSLFPEIQRTPTSAIPGAPVFPAVAAPATTLLSAQQGFLRSLQERGASTHTVDAFARDLVLFHQFAGDIAPRFLYWLQHERGVPYKPKSYQRRLTTLKSFCAWLTEIRALATNPADTVAFLPVASPLPDILYAEPIARLLDAAHVWHDAPKPDARPCLLITLLLTTGIKKSKAMAIRLTDLDWFVGEQPILYVRYAYAKHWHKALKLKLPADFADAFARYRAQYQPRARLFECTSRHLENVLTQTARAAGLNRFLSFEDLRWTCAVRDLQNGVPAERVRVKLGLSETTWDEAGLHQRLEPLVAPAM